MSCWQFLSEFDKCGLGSDDHDDNEDHDDNGDHDDDGRQDHNDDCLGGTEIVQKQIAVCNDQQYGDLTLPVKITLLNNVVYTRRKKMPKIINFPFFEKKQ